MSQDWSVDRVRSTFIDFYKSKAHTFVPSSPVIPHEDPTLLFANAGMNQFKPIFLGQVDPGTPMGKLKRAANSQKCIRAGGKHNDLEDVGKDTYHHTMFEMLGTWSFGDYFKKESIEWGWELLTKVYGLPADRLYATYFGGNPNMNLQPDFEARDLWLQFLPASRVIPGNMKDNFWMMGDTGPCGPCSEIHFDRIGGREATSLVNSGDPDVLEIWNHVFIQFNADPAGLKPLPAKHVDTGMGLERLVSVLQNKRSNYDTDVFAPLFVAIERITGARKPYTGKLGAADKDNSDTAYRVIADHIRTLTFAITDGALPSNEGRGYVLRRILRRAVRYGSQTLGARPGFLSELVPVVVDTMGGFFPELKKNPEHVKAVIRDEEESFGRTLARGLVLFDEACVRSFTKARLIPHLQAGGATVTSSREGGNWTLAIHDKDGVKSHAVSRLSEINAAWADAYFSPSRSITAEDAFKLYDTYGFPIDLTNLMAEERGLKVDQAGFDKLMEEAKDRARAGSSFKGGTASLSLPTDAVAKLKALNIEPTADLDKFHGRPIRATVRAIYTGTTFEDRADAAAMGVHPVGIVLDKTNFYAEMGGQQADEGRLIEFNIRMGDESSRAELRVEDVKSYGGYVLHVGHLVKGQINIGDTVQCELDATRRGAIAGNHTATHLLNLALRETLGTGVEQKGSQVAPDKLRFDFSHGKPVEHAELERIEQRVIAEVKANHTVYTEPTELTRAKTIKGVRAVFGETYPDPVRVVSVGRPVADMLAEIDAGRAERTSVEFCGGTHVTATSAIGGFCLAGEEAVAKGVRRIVALTGVPALAAHKAAQELGQRLTALDAAPADKLDAELKEVKGQVDTMTLPLLVKLTLRQQIAALEEKKRTAGKQASAAFANEVVAHAKSIAQSTEWDAGVSIITTINAGSDREALTAALNTIRAVRSRHAVLLISPDAEAGKLTILAAVPDTLIKRGLSAGDWVRAAATACGGKGGGKPDLAQGGGTDLSKLKETIVAAKAFAFGKCPN